MAATDVHMMTEAELSVDELRRARARLVAAIDRGQAELAELRDLIEDELVEALNRRRREARR